MGNKREDRKPRNPFLFFLLKEMFRWEVVDMFEKADKDNISRYIMLKRPIPMGYVPQELRDDEKKKIVSNASYFRREIFDTIKSLSFSEVMLDRLAISISKLGNFQSWEKYCSQFEQDTYKVWVDELIKSKENSRFPDRKPNYQNLSVKEKNRINMKVAARIDELVSIITIYPNYFEVQDFFRENLDLVDVFFVRCDLAFRAIKKSDLNNLQHLINHLQNEEFVYQKVEWLLRVPNAQTWLIINDVNQVLGCVSLALLSKRTYNSILAGKNFYELLDDEIRLKSNVAYVYIDNILYKDVGINKTISRHLRRMVEALTVDFPKRNESLAKLCFSLKNNENLLVEDRAYKGNKEKIIAPTFISNSGRKIHDIYMRDYYGGLGF